MTRRSKLGWIAGGLFTFVNVGGAMYAASLGEDLHATVHMVLLVLGLVGYLTWRLATLSRRQNLPPALKSDERIEYLQQSVDAIALELERIGEKQRFSDRLSVERGETPLLKKEQ